MVYGLQFLLMGITYNIHDEKDDKGYHPFCIDLTF